jgi:hypothetical protein
MNDSHTIDTFCEIFLKQFETSHPGVEYYFICDSEGLDIILNTPWEQENEVQPSQSPFEGYSPPLDTGLLM